MVAGRDRETAEAVAAELGGDALELDLASLASVRAARAAAAEDLDAVICNAGLQITDGLTLTEDGFEETFQVNVLGHVALVDALLERPNPPRTLIWIGSATHDPSQPTGLPDPSDNSVEVIARPASEPSRAAGTEGRRRYATAKLLTTALAGAYARERDAVHVACFDPGLMPGTGLARTYPRVLRAVWSAATRPLALLPFASTPRVSGEALAGLALERPPPGPSGAVLDYRLRPAAHSARAADPQFQDEVLRACRALLGNTVAGCRGTPRFSGGSTSARTAG